MRLLIQKKKSSLHIFGGPLLNQIGVRPCYESLMFISQYPNEQYIFRFEHYGQKIVVDDQEYDMTLWDTAGQEDYERLRPLSYPHVSYYSYIKTIFIRNIIPDQVLHSIVTTQKVQGYFLKSESEMPLSPFFIAMFFKYCFGNDNHQKLGYSIFFIPNKEVYTVEIRDYIC